MPHQFPFFLILSLLATSLCSGQDPGTGCCKERFSYQGALTTSIGVPVPDGMYSLTFKVFNARTGGDLRYTETQESIPFQRGVFNAILGGSNPFPLSSNESLYVEITINSGPGISEPQTMTSRTEITRVPYAMQSLSLLGPQSIATGAAAIAGGRNNRAEGAYAVVGGGGGASATDSNSAIGSYSMIPGGRANKTLGRYALAAGRRAKAEHDGSFVWADSTDADFASTGINQFLIRATGGVGINKTSPAAPLDILGGRWNPVDTEGDLRIGNDIYRLKIGVAIEGGGAGDVRLNAQGGSNRMMLGGGANDVLTVTASNVGIGTIYPQGALDVSSTTGGFIVPRMSTPERDALTPVNGMIIYNTMTNQFNFYENNAWVTK